MDITTPRLYEVASAPVVWTMHQAEAFASCAVWTDPLVVGTSK